MWDLRDWGKLQKPSARRAWKATWGHLLALQSFTHLRYSHFGHILCICENASTRKTYNMSYLMWPHCYSNPRARVCEVCSSWKCTDRRRRMQSVLITPKYPHHSSNSANLKWHQMGWLHKTIGAILFWMRDRTQLFSAVGSVRMSHWFQPRFQHGSRRVERRAERIFSLQGAITNSTWKQSCLILFKTWC